MRRALLVACCPLLLAVEVYRRGYVAPVLFGMRGHARSFAFWEPDPIG